MNLTTHDVDDRHDVTQLGITISHLGFWQPSTVKNYPSSIHHRPS